MPRNIFSVYFFRISVVTVWLVLPLSAAASISICITNHEVYSEPCESLGPPVNVSDNAIGLSDYLQEECIGDQLACDSRDEGEQMPLYPPDAAVIDRIDNEFLSAFMFTGAGERIIELDDEVAHDASTSQWLIVQSGAQPSQVPGYDGLSNLENVAGFQWQLATDILFSSPSLIVDRSTSLGNVGAMAYIPSELMIPGVTYWFRYRVVSKNNGVSDWYPPFLIYNFLATIDDIDSNLNGVADEHECGLPESCILPITFPSAVPLLILSSLNSSALLGVASDIGILDNVSVFDPLSLPAGSALLQEMPHGLLSFNIRNLPVSVVNPASVTVSVYFEDSLPSGTKWMKYDPISHQLEDFSSHAQFYGNRVDISLTDGGAGDVDGVVNGIIVDPGGPVIPATTSGGSAAVSSGGGGGGCSMNPQARFDPVLIMILAGLVVVLRQRRRH